MRNSINAKQVANKMSRFSAKLNDVVDMMNTSGFGSNDTKECVTCDSSSEVLSQSLEVCNLQFVECINLSSIFLFIQFGSFVYQILICRKIVRVATMSIKSLRGCMVFLAKIVQMVVGPSEIVWKMKYVRTKLIMSYYSRVYFFSTNETLNSVKDITVNFTLSFLVRKHIKQITVQNCLSGTLTTKQRTVQTNGCLVQFCPIKYYRVLSSLFLKSSAPLIVL